MGRSRRPRSRSVTHISTCGNYKLRGTPKQIAEKYEALAAEKEGTVDAELFKQHAEYWHKVANQEQPVMSRKPEDK